MKVNIKIKKLYIAIFFANFAYADYQIIIPLDPKGIIMEETPINGTPDGLYSNKQIYINGVRCNQTGSIFDIYGDSYQYDNCVTGLSTRAGQTLRVYMD